MARRKKQTKQQILRDKAKLIEETYQNLSRFGFELLAAPRKDGGIWCVMRRSKAFVLPKRMVDSRDATPIADRIDDAMCALMKRA